MKGSRPWRCCRMLMLALTRRWRSRRRFMPQQATVLHGTPADIIISTAVNDAPYGKAGDDKAYGRP